MRDAERGGIQNVEDGLLCQEGENITNADGGKFSNKGGILNKEGEEI